MSQNKERTILVVDDEERNWLVMEPLLMPLGHRVAFASSGNEALEIVVKEPPDVILLDVMMPGMDGFSVCKVLKSDEKTRLIPVIMVTTLDGTEDRVRAFESDADDFLTKPVNRYELQARVRSSLRIKSLNDELECSESVLFSLAEAVEARDAYTVGHSRRVASYAVDLGRAIELHSEGLRDLLKGGLLHDIGKIGIPDSILRKNDKLTDEEYRVIQEHPVIGEKICRPLQSFTKLFPLIRNHHERLDGSGYPDGLCGEEIPLTVRILTIADIFDALNTARPYRSEMPENRIREIFEEEVDRGWLDGELVGQALVIMPSWLSESSSLVKLGDL